MAEVILHFRALPNGISLQKWREMDPAKVDREQLVRGYELVVIDRTLLTPDDEPALQRIHQPQAIRGATWFLVGYEITHDGPIDP